jgi:non-canonical purine NTP pyrophosphatase (RdgB/HAM1 family)
MELPPFVLVTGNPDRVREARRILGRPVEARDVHLPEIQSLDLLEVLRAKAREAFRRLGEPLVVEETGLYLGALNGFPGPLVKWMLASAGPDGVARTAIALGDASAEARCALLFTDGSRDVVAQGETRGELVLPPRGVEGFGWDPVFQPAGGPHTYGELSPEEKDRIGHRGKAWRALADLLLRLPT